MKIAIAAEGTNVSSHFGHCPHFLIIETDGSTIVNTQVLQNPGHRPGFLPVFLAEQGVNVVIAGGMGETAQQLFAQNGIQVFTGICGPIDDTVNLYLEGNLVSGNFVCHEHQHAGGCGRQH